MGGHPEFDIANYMDFGGHEFESAVDFSGLCLVGATFDSATFGGDAVFKGSTDFRRAVFNGVPAFFNASLHEDTDFSAVERRQAKAEKTHADYAIRAWERLELTMTQLEKPADRHRFYRLKMCVRRWVDGPLLGALNWLFDVTCEYGWGLGRALAWWLGHWVLSGIVLFVNAGAAAVNPKWPTFAEAAVGTAFSNAHAFLGLTRAGSYLEPGRELLEHHDQFGLLVRRAAAIHAGSLKPGGRNEENWRSTLRDYVFSRLANMPVDAVTGTDVMAVLLPIWTTKQETAGRMKAAREHRVPLSNRALAVLDEARRELPRAGNLLFPLEKGRMQGHHPMGMMMKALEIGAVPHGFRSSFRDWAAECTETPREVCELALAHVNSDRVEAAYRRSDLFERRRVIMQQWTDYIALNP